MKSLLYRFLHKPKTLSDCLDFMQKEKPGTVMVTVTVEPLETGFFSFFTCRAYFFWKFKTVTCSYYVDYGVIRFDGCSKKRRDRDGEQAEKQLKADLHILQKEAVPFQINRETFLQKEG